LEKSKTILIADNDRQAAIILGEKFLPSLGFHTIVCFDGSSTIRTAREQAVDLMLLDQSMPDFHYLEILRGTAKEGIPLSTILFLPQDAEVVSLEALRLGVQDILIKPYNPKDLTAAIHRVLSRNQLAEEKDELANQLKNQTSWMAVLSKVGRSVTSTLELDEVLRRIVDAAVWLTKAEEGYLALVEEESNQLYLRAIKSVSENQTRNLNLPTNDSLIHKVIETRRPLRTAKRPEEKPIKVASGFLVRSLLHVPLVSKGNALGVLGVDNIADPSPFSETEEFLLATLADYATVAIENAHLYTHIQQTAITDELTGLYNRRGLFELGKREVERSLRFGRQLPVLMIDIDFFKEVNDTYGHMTGDQVLRVLAQRFRRNVREIDIVGRYGGEEFVILLLENDLPTALMIAERLRLLVSSIPVHTDQGLIDVTVSMGVTAVAQDVRDLPTLLQRADEALYTAKSSGRNRIAVG
jgi:diguanylate cyclase (GGDEF)-like protein